MPSALICLALLLVLAVVLHRNSAAKPLYGRPEFADFAACAVGAFFYTLFLYLSFRPLFALAAGALLLTGLWCVNAAKIKALRGEPLVFADIALVRQVIQFPRLYLPFLPCKALALGAVAGGAGLAVLWALSPQYKPSAVWIPAAVWPFLMLLLLKSRFGDRVEEFLLKKFPLRFEPRADALRYGPLGATLLHVCWHLTLRGRRGLGIIDLMVSPPSTPPWPREALSLPPDPGALPNIFLVQAESFSDPRLFSPLIPRNVLAHFDEIRASGLSGDLAVTPYGAYTMRTEFSLLTGQAPSTLGTDAFHPYLSASRHPTWSMARYLREVGYRTVCLHPFDGKFFLRHKSLPNLGFDEFISLENFPHTEHYGPYVSDDSVAQSMLEQLQEEKPVFCFAITMENHGPWGKNRLGDRMPDDAAPRLSGLPLQVCRYLAHLRHADSMIKTLREGLRRQRRPGVLGWYGDHLPNLPMLIPQGQTATPYFIWSTEDAAARTHAGETGSVKTDSVAPEAFGGVLLSYAALTLRLRANQK